MQVSALNLLIAAQQTWSSTPAPRPQAPAPASANASDFEPLLFKPQNAPADSETGTPATYAATSAIGSRLDIKV